VCLMRPVQTGELDGISNKEDRKVVADDIPIPFICEHLQSETSDVPHCVGRSL
jgi:hypothetical protein